MREDEIKKAEALIKEFNFQLPGYEGGDECFFLTKEEATRLAIKCVDNILQNIEATKLYHPKSEALPSNEKYWLGVKSVLKDKLSIRENDN
jgi:PleD family two-component response regulator